MASNFVGFPPNQFVAVTPNFGLYPQHQTPLQPHSQTPSNFGSYSQHQTPPETQPYFQTQPESHSEVEFVAETQFISQPRRLHDSDTEDSVEEIQQQDEDTEPRGKGKSTERTERKGWTDVEVKVLAEA